MPDTHVTIQGTLSRDPDVRHTSEGQPRAAFCLEVPDAVALVDPVEFVQFFNVTCYGRLAEHVAQSLAKGGRVIVTGHLRQRAYQNDKGERRNLVDVVADDVAISLREGLRLVATSS